MGCSLLCHKGFSSLRKKQHVSECLCDVNTECSGSVCGENLVEEPCVGSDGLNVFFYVRDVLTMR